ncbi:MAG: TonB-dependent receptor [Deltaproteobacteria bacterium]|nr:TonB-dependent receptor [Deltaproteobacteria bacterium]
MNCIIPFKKSLGLGLKTLTLAGFFSASFFCAHPVWADDAGKSKDHQVFDLGEITVLVKSESPQAMGTVSVVTAADIEREHATNLGEALKLVPGVVFRQGRTKTGYYATIRGFEQESVQILMDGMPLGVPYEGLVNLTDIPVHNIAEIRVIKGLASPLYGGNALGGVIEIITKKGSARPSLSANFEAAEGSTYGASATHGNTVGRFSYFLGASMKQSDGFKLAEDFTLPRSVLASMAKAPSNPAKPGNEPIATDTGIRDNGDYDRKTVSFTGDFSINQDHKIGLSAEYYKDEYGVPPVPIYREHKKGFFWFPRYWRFTEWERHTVNLIEESRFCEAFSLKTRIYYDGYRNVLDTYDGSDYTTQDRLSPPSGPSLYDDYDTGAVMNGFLRFNSSHLLGLGISAKKDVHEENFLYGAEDAYESFTYSFSADYRWCITKALTANLGASYDMFDKDYRKQAGVVIEDAGRDLSAFCPQAGLRFDATDTLSLFATAGTKVRFPTMRNLYSAGVIGPLGDPNLIEQTTTHYETGCDWAFSPKASLEIALFYDDVENCINFDNLLGRFEQYSEAAMQGFEISLSGEILSGLSGKIAYSYLDTSVDSPVTLTNTYFRSLTYTPDELPYRPQYKLDAGLSYKAPFGITLETDGSWIGAQTFYDHADAADNKHLVAVKKSLDSYFLWNARVNVEIGRHAKAYLGVENILNEEYYYIDMLPGSGATAFGGMRFDL